CARDVYGTGFDYW
nr:immunoglobulin heavy chain junction region [Macaca mulatta]MOW75770.1 immunoglobulin heavy chain junction region [Macaca mulatta]MOW75798.1 immunoglobulin heavy chain junction region [Macaca mulatta]MOW75934.1 immunoglobulin heavy chain junction region [Macaca mulatta]MOW75951.1 immunoglobulin heavy chain junction region [Macaca mulatta]